jgi:hypothetical protein
MSAQTRITAPKEPIRDNHGRARKPLRACLGGARHQKPCVGHFLWRHGGGVPICLTSLHLRSPIYPFHSTIHRTCLAFQSVTQHARTRTNMQQNHTKRPEISTERTLFALLIHALHAYLHSLRSCPTAEPCGLSCGCTYYPARGPFALRIRSAECNATAHCPGATMRNVSTRAANHGRHAEAFHAGRVHTDTAPGFSTLRSWDCGNP